MHNLPKHIRLYWKMKFIPLGSPLKSTQIQPKIQQRSFEAINIFHAFAVEVQFDHNYCFEYLYCKLVLNTNSCYVYQRTCVQKVNLRLLLIVHNTFCKAFINSIKKLQALLWTCMCKHMNMHGGFSQSQSQLISWSN